MENPPGSSRSDMALRRINYMHRRYQINSEHAWYVFGLYVFVTIDMISKYEWRSLLEAEKQAIYQYWMGYLAKKMGFSPSTVIDSYQKFEGWFRKYHSRHQVHHPLNSRLGNVTLEYFRSILPTYLQWLSDPVVLSLCGPLELHAIFHCPDMPDCANERLKRRVWPSLLISGGFFLRRCIVRYLCFPKEIPRRTPESKRPDGSYVPNWEISPGCIYANGYKIESIGPPKFAHRFGELYH
ncbi:hypothetical protein K493DRAFT_318513 [Basidiobolus meristosporus CBS 931.73]|uniref:ER-bound oxygenase mpaB/mpaB'/Rubber oxygenase catalytic domain-containing protein n=1 Tax=Basidiobolus meristosporus CBS 931.73 TaxID=1314790 RepID=A0A1Y1XVA8_9FUNG|nr:hypothetical protein K493DRAFT_321495 [Basidiobolus meristosporus CBS 931.73]ORX89702.1 hypothetical protein K493DRAFT_318513 [Basidiobolus meristosporus CBS 931.73]|eukprot:ORX76871.1 hypothetical protein K493DRAFT_321495 [Basidiobolus meristosporus CBS 931.73]